MVCVSIEARAVPLRHDKPKTNEHNAPALRYKFSTIPYSSLQKKGSVE